METHQETITGRPAPTQRILVVDDDLDVLSIVAEILRSFGYEVIEANGPEEAIQAAENDQPIDLLLTDVRMPGMNGHYLARLLRQRRPDLKVLFMTGYGGDVLYRDGALEADLDVLEKPFSLDELSQRVEDVLRTPLELVH